MKKFSRYSLLAFVILTLLSSSMLSLVSPVSAATAPCVNSTPPISAYTATLCITAPADGATFHANGTITATVTVIGANPGVRKITFYLNGAYVLTDFAFPFTFTFPANKYVDGTYLLSAEAVMKDNFTTSQANISVTLATGTTSVAPNPNTFSPATGTTPADGQPFIVAAAGDGAGGEPNAASVTNLISSMNPNLFLYIGDVYERGTYAEFLNWYASNTFFGRFKPITDPTVGNHDYLQGNDNLAYRDYWNNVPDYYSFDAGGWHFISLNSFDQRIDVSTTSPEYLWLQSDLAAHPDACTIAFYHHPYLSIGEEGNRPSLVDIWKLMAQYKVSLVINGHDHEYQRWFPLDGDGKRSPLGMTQFVVGTGGHSLQNLVTYDSRVAVASAVNPDAYGALKLALTANSITFTYMSISGTSLDTGTIPCQAKVTTPSTSIFMPIIFR
jgi:hypothetical protein